MVKKIIVSIVVPVYNEEKQILNFHQNITKILNKPVEIIYINDKSTDNTKKILSALISTSDKIKLFSNTKNLGPTGAANQGARIAKGDFLYFASVSDTFQTNFIPFKFLKRKYSLVTTNYCVTVFKFLKIKKTPFLYSKSTFCRPKNIIKNFKLSRTIIGGAATLFNKKRFFQYNGFPTDVGGHSDFVLIYKLALLHGIYFVNRCEVNFKYNIFKQLGTHRKNFQKNTQLQYLRNLKNHFKINSELYQKFIRSRLICKLPFGKLV